MNGGLYSVMFYSLWNDIYPRVSISCHLNKMKDSDALVSTLQFYLKGVCLTSSHFFSISFSFPINTLGTITYHNFHKPNHFHLFSITDSFQRYMSHDISQCSALILVFIYNTNNVGRIETAC